MLNTDVLSRIFETAVEADPSSLSTIRSVNCEWFATAGKTPKLWSKLNLNRKIRFTDPEYVRLHLQNSGEIPLNITITLPEDLPYDTDIPALGELRKAVHKIKSLIIEMPSAEAWQKFVSGIGEGQPAPLLERLVLKVNDAVYDVSHNAPFATLSTALTPSPNLIHLQLPAWPLPAHPPPQLSSVTSLAFVTPFSGLYIPALFPLVQAARYLQHFAFKAVDYGAESDPNYWNIICVPQLRTANVTVPGFGLDLLRNFHAPLFTDVRLDGYREVVPDSVWEEDDWGLDERQTESNLLTLLTSRSRDIRRLELHYIHLEHPKEDYNRLLGGQAFPVLEELILERANIPDTALIESAGGHSSLKKLELCNCKYISADGLRSFVHGRAYNEFVLSIQGCPAISEEDIESLSKIVRVESKSAAYLPPSW
ncbi:hypothetical protein LshimejAT787_1301660 [Lyophyllum shimeji]|uniref:F-box domain-containing protein n=1 Tax=Lyophyllum shimeji TaxID=47721 RepID=A0A9P3PWF8_LYOSH|nr:hypothetical protein LshimejAT787_1301660 [Lyophyllum shimeji]